MSLSHRKATTQDLDLIKRLLENESLPSSDLDLTKIDLYLFTEGDHLIGISGLECSAPFALLRSMVVPKNLQGQGIGKRILQRSLEIARHQEINELYLLTETAGPFFEKLGFSQGNREDAPDFIKSTVQFSHLCPASAEFLHLKLSKDHHNS